MKILFSWTGVTSYMADCWRRLQSVNGVDLKVIVETAHSGREFDAARTLHDIDCELVNEADAANCEIRTFRTDFVPDVIFVGGWRSVTTRRVVERYDFAAKIFCLDMPWRRSIRCVVARFALAGFLRRFDAVYVPGESSAFYAKWLGFPRDRIFRKLYAVDQKRFAAASESSARSARVGFVFVGRKSPEKRIDVIEKAYECYRELGGTWSVEYYGQGGKFVQADEVPGIYASHACLLLASSFDPWPLVMLEARSAGMEVIASDRCGNCGELGAFVVPYGNVEAMARTMLTVERGAKLPPPNDLSSYDCGEWAARTVEIAEQILSGMKCEANGMLVVDRLLRKNGLMSEDEVWVHGMWTPDKWWSCIKAKLTGKRLVRMTHGSLSPVYLRRQGKWKKFLVKPIEKLLFAISDRVVTTGEWENEWAKGWGLDRPLEIVDIRKFFVFDASGCARRMRALAERSADVPIRLLYVGRIHPLKGCDVLEEAVKELNGESFAVELRVVCDHFGEALENDFAWADALVLPSFSENFGLVVAEALSRGIPVITTDGAPAWETVKGVKYIRGYADASRNECVKMLKSAILELRGGSDES